jgi:hypothetical protein
MFGPFYIANPDFELQNFTPTELVTIAIELACEQGVIDPPSEDDLQRRVAHVRSNKQFFAALSGTSCEGIHKGEKWGAALMKYALNHRDLPDGHPYGRRVRQVVEIAEMIVRGTRSGYRRSILNSRVDPATGEIVRTSGP